jgi:phage baseplate assembly protein gpV
MGNLQSLIERDVASAREGRVPGLVTALVSDIRNDGTYLVTYLNMGGDHPSAPARVMMPMAGRRRGTYFMPEIGDEVIVAFELGDTSLPIILGAVWNDDDEPPDQAQPSRDNHVRTIVSRSGHEVTLDDTPGAEKVTIKTKGGHELVLDDTPPGSVKLRSKGGGELEISDGAGSLTLRAPTSISFECPNISFSANAGMSISAPAGVQINTTNSLVASALIIDGTPIGLHTHTLPSGSTGPVSGS